MPNFETHLKTGILTGLINAAGKTLLKEIQKVQQNPNQEIDWLRITRNSALGGIAGGIGGSLPDTLEPADNPHHRKFFHSKMVAVSVGTGMYYNEKSELNEDAKIVISSAGYGYISHLLLDSQTPRGLPII